MPLRYLFPHERYPVYSPHVERDVYETEIDLTDDELADWEECARKYREWQRRFDASYKAHENDD